MHLPFFLLFPGINCWMKPLPVIQYSRSFRSKVHLHDHPINLNVLLVSFAALYFILYNICFYIVQHENRNINCFQFTLQVHIKPINIIDKSMDFIDLFLL